MNEAAGYYRGGLTPKQKKEAEAAIYGLSGEKMTPGFSAEEIERMRQMVAAHDQASGANRPKEFDLNNPPKAPYTHQEYPRVMYHHGKRQHKHAHSEADVTAAEAAGWSKEPFPSEPVDIPLDAESAKEAAELDAKLKKKSKA